MSARIWAVRGATTIERDQPAQVLAATRELLQELFTANGIRPADIISIFFTVTPDIRSEFPAVAARELGLADTPLMCAQEIAKDGALPLCIRVMLHFHTELDKGALRPVYLNDAVKLRPDLVSG
ncbi:chorismate mutase [Hydrogenispora ethanolica]|jgi:chorismate mutase|uniref:chorismate mutase n=1 Tax=Hydrogenispora ethanolica TaxID=1082276 RepID=A0A4R1RQF3_HYDET|nr:chorismate mutase [Hydrogenispora ethanolica]TCL68534.1 chorismate mutase [Hydrogenispora ethanolica]